MALRTASQTRAYECIGAGSISATCKNSGAQSAAGFLLDGVALYVPFASDIIGNPAPYESSVYFGKTVTQNSGDRSLGSTWIRRRLRSLPVSIAQSGAL